MLKAWLWLVERGQFIGLCMLMVSLPLSNFFISVSTFWLIGAAAAEIITLQLLHQPYPWPKRSKWREPYWWLLTSIYFLPLAGLLWTSDFRHALWDLNIKLPFLFMPALFVLLKPISDRQRHWLWAAFIGSLFVTASICFSIYLGVWHRPFRDIREISIFISHIRFSLLLVLGISAMVWLWFKSPTWRWPGVFVTAYFITFLWIIESVTGFAVLAIVCVWWLCHLLCLTQSKTLKLAASISILLLPIMTGWYLMQSYFDYFCHPLPDFSRLERVSANGNAYVHDTLNRQLENGHLVWLYVQPDEFRSAWNSRSKISFDSTDANGELIAGTAIRYITSLGLRKDSAGVNALSDEDVQRIEQGVTNVHLPSKSGLRRRIDKIWFEYDVYRNGGSPSGHSVLQRIEFWRAAAGIVAKQPWTGVGTGDVKRAFNKEYERMNSGLSEGHRLRAHNQYLTFAVTYGIPGLMWFIWVLFYPVWKLKRWRQPLYMSFFLIAALSFITEDTLETQVGVTFFVFFNCFLLLLRPSVDGRPVEG